MVDWAEVNFIIGTNPDSFIEIKYDKKSVDTDLGLKAYMNTLITAHEVISQFNLKRVLKYWGFNDGSHIYFMLAPPWIKFNPALVYSSVIKNQTEYVQMKDGNTNAAGGNVGLDYNNDNYQDNKSSSMNMKMQSSILSKTNLFKEPQLYSKDIDI